MLTKELILGICSSIAFAVLVLMIFSKINDKNEIYDYQSNEVFETLQVSSRVLSYYPSFIEIGSFGIMKILYPCNI
jgi:hypothetical protein